MAIRTNTKLAINAREIREDLGNVITRLAREETPLQSILLKKKKINSTTPEWLEDSLSPINTANKHLQGDEFVNDPSTTIGRPKNQTQIYTKTVEISRTYEAVNKAGMASAIGYEREKKLVEGKRDFEYNLFGNLPSIAATSSVPGQLGGLETWATTAVSRGSGGANGGYNSGTGLTVAPTDGTQRAFSFDQLMTVMGAGYSAGSKFDTLLMGMNQKVRLDAMLAVSGNIRYVEAEDETIKLKVQFIETSFGRIKAVVEPQAVGPTPGAATDRSRTVQLLDTSKIFIGELDPWQKNELAKTSDSIREAWVMESTLMPSTEKAIGIVADLTY